MSRGEPDIKAIFTAALELPEGPERDAYLDAACGGDAGLRRRIEDLLAAFARASDVLGPSGTPAAAIADAATTNADAAPGTSEPARGADLEATDARTHATDSRPRIDHGPETAPGEPGTTAALDDRGSGRDGDALPPGTARALLRRLRDPPRARPRRHGRRLRGPPGLASTAQSR